MSVITSGKSRWRDGVPARAWSILCCREDAKMDPIAVCKALVAAIDLAIGAASAARKRVTGALVATG